ncbi:hypothetical protein D3C76_1265640 [compost metagenome]
MVITQHFHQPPAAQVVGQVPLGAHQDALPIEGPVQGDLAIVCAQATAHFHRLALLAAAEPPDAERSIVLAQHDAVVAGQVFWRFWGAVGRQVSGRRAQPAAVGRDLAGNQARVRQLTKADSHIDGIVRQGDGAVGQVQLHLYFWVAVGKRRHGRPHMRTTKTQRCIDP